MKSRGGMDHFLWFNEHVVDLFPMSLDVPLADGPVYAQGTTPWLFSRVGQLVSQQ